MRRDSWVDGDWVSLLMVLVKTQRLVTEKVVKPTGYETMMIFVNTSVRNCTDKETKKDEEH